MSATPPDSGEPEALKREADRMRVVEISADLAHRILVALGKAWPLTDAESAESKALADELRKVMGRP